MSRAIVPVLPLLAIALLVLRVGFLGDLVDHALIWSREWRNGTLVDLGIIAMIYLLFSVFRADEHSEPKVARLSLLRCASEVVSGRRELWAIGLSGVVVAAASFGGLIWFVVSGPQSRGPLGLIAWSGAAASLGIVACVLKRLQGEDPAFSDGVRAIRQHALACLILPYFGLNSGSKYAQTRTTLWNLLVIPVMLVERLSPTHAAIRAKNMALELFGEESMVWKMARTVYWIAITSIMLAVGGVIGVFILDGCTDGAIFPSDRSPSVVVAPLAITLFALALYVSFYAILCLITFISATYLHATGSAKTQEMIRLHFPVGMLGRNRLESVTK